VSETKREANPALFAQLQAHQMEDGNVGPRYMLSITGDPKPPTTVIPLSGRGGLRQDVMRMLVNMNISLMRDESRHQFIMTDSLSIQEIQSAFARIALSPQEERVIRALQFIEPKIERIATTGTTFFFGPGGPMRGGLKAKLSGQNEPVPIGSLGEGIWRLMTLAIAISSVKDSLLFIDEIDTGLHYTVLEKMWTFIADAAKEFNVQVFATTHSLDCVYSLAAICRSDHGIENQVTIQRLELGEEHTVPYDEAEIVALAGNHIEAR
jgi:predicted ATPase